MNPIETPYWDEDYQSLMLNECSWDSMFDLVKVGMMNMCGCQSDEAFEKLISLLELCERKDGQEWIGFEQMCEKIGESSVITHILLQYLNNAKLIEHGTSIRGAWLTDKGKECLAAYAMIQD